MKSLYGQKCVSYCFNKKCNAELFTCFQFIFISYKCLTRQIAADALLGKKIGDAVVLAPPMLKMLPTMFAWPQLVTALTGGIIALAIVPVLRKALHR